MQTLDRSKQRAGSCVQGVSTNGAKLRPWLFRQTDLFAKSLQARVATKQSQFRISKVLADPPWSFRSHPRKSFEGETRKILFWA